MADVEETKLLRNLVFSSILVLSATAAFAQETANEPLEFAPNSQGVIKTPIMQMLNDAKELGQEWQSTLDIQEANDFGVKLDVEALRERALNNPRVRALLGADDGEAKGDAAGPKYGSDRIFILLSFSMPEESLRSVMVEADRFGVPIVMRGFVKNDAYATQTAIQRVFKNDAESIGFNIDPTIFTRFNVTSVPQLIVVNDDLGSCETQGCEGDVAPPHDVVRGNIPIEAALRIIADGEGDASSEAQKALEAAGL